MEGATATGKDGPPETATGEHGLISENYAHTDFACAFYYRHELRKLIENFLFIGVAKRSFFGRRCEVADPWVLEGKVAPKTAIAGGAD